MKKQKLLCVVGPTASGKTALGIALAKRFEGEVVSADSMQIYRGIHIASAAPDADELCGVPHHLIEFLPLGSRYTVADYVTDAKREIAEIAARGKLPVVVGGTGLYVDTLTAGIRFAPEESDGTVRARLTEELERFGGEEMLCRLREIDAEAAARLHPNDTRRILRALEIFEVTGMTRSQADALSRTGEAPFDVLYLGITFRDRQKLYERINRRVDRMLENGLADEARSTYGTDCAGAGQAIGHKELYPWLAGEISSEEAAERLKQATRRYAKRQLTWFRKNENIRWIEADECENPADEAVKIIEKEEWLP